MKERIPFEHYAMLIAYAASLRSEDPHRRVGAAGFNSLKKTVGTAYNGLVSGVKVPGSFWDDRNNRRKYCLHAEQNLMSLMRPEECYIVAVTCHPCPSCATLLCACGVKHILFGSLYETDDKREAQDVFKFYHVKTEYIPLEECLPFMAFPEMHIKETSSTPKL